MDMFPEEINRIAFSAVEEILQTAGSRLGIPVRNRHIMDFIMLAIDNLVVQSNDSPSGPEGTAELLDNLIDALEDGREKILDICTDVTNEATEIIRRVAQ